jgi:hypothetical protein
MFRSTRGFEISEQVVCELKEWFGDRVAGSTSAAYPPAAAVEGVLGNSRAHWTLAARVSREPPMGSPDAALSLSTVCLQMPGPQPKCTAPASLRTRLGRGVGSVPIAGGLRTLWSRPGRGVDAMWLRPQRSGLDSTTVYLRFTIEVRVWIKLLDHRRARGLSDIPVPGKRSRPAQTQSVSALRTATRTRENNFTTGSQPGN